MSAELKKHLVPVRSRVRRRSALHFAVLGAVVGSVFLLALEFVRLTCGVELSSVAMVTVLTSCAFAGCIYGFLQKCDWPSIAALIDRRCDLSDRTVTALAFSEGSAVTNAFRQLQIEDAILHLQNVDAKAVAPIARPRRWQYAPFVLFCGLRLFMTPTIGSDPRQLFPSPLHAAAVVAEIQMEIDDLETLAEETATQDLKELVSRLKQDLKRLKVPTLTVRDSMKTVSEMQQKMQAMMRDMDVAAMDAQLRNVGEAIAGARPFKPAAEALDDDKLMKAADALEGITEEELSAEKMKPAESRPMAEKLADAADAAREEGLDELSEQLSDLSESVKSGDAKQATESVQELAQTIKRQNANRQLSNLLKNKSDQLSQSKKRLAVESQSEGDGSMAGKGQNLKTGKTGKSKNDIASQKAGAKSAGNIDGARTQLETQRQLERIAGQLGDEGVSDTETETVAAPESHQKAQRKAQEAFNRYQKMSDTVLDTEAIPPGHRETIRRYFERIRPDSTP